MAATPRRTLTAEQRRERDAQYRVDPKQFTTVLKGLVQVFNSLVLLNSALGQAGKGSYLVWQHPEQPGQLIQFNRRHLRSANSKFARALVELKNYLRVSRKKTREPVRPESFSGTYTPVYAGEALRHFFTAAPGNFGPLNPVQAAQTQQAGAALMDSLPRAQQGYLLRNTSTMLFYIYAHANQLQDAENAQFARSDAIMNESFGGAIPAAFYSVRGGDGKTVKVSMDEAVRQGAIQAPLNTYQVIQVTHPEFNPQRFNTYFFQNIAAANYYSRNALAAEQGGLAAQAAVLNQPDIRQAMLNEHNIVKQVSAQWHDLLEPGRKANRDARKREQDAQKRATGGGGRGRGRGGAQGR